MLDINLPLIVAQVITFLVGLFLLWLIAYKPIMGIFSRRADQIKQDLDAAEAARLKMEAAKGQYDRELAALAEKGREIVQQAARAGQEAREAIVQEARGQGQELLRQAAERIALEKAKALKELRQEVVALSIQVAEKVLREAVTPAVDQRLINQTLDQLETQSKG